MKRVGTADLKAHLSAHLREVRRGETITVLDRRQPIARIVPIDDPSLGLVVRAASGPLGDVAIPGPTRESRDVVEGLLAERADRT